MPANKTVTLNWFQGDEAGGAKGTAVARAAFKKQLSYTPQNPVYPADEARLALPSSVDAMATANIGNIRAIRR